MKDFTIRCPRCRGTGKNPDQKVGCSVCPVCRGKGEVKKG